MHWKIGRISAPVLALLLLSACATSDRASTSSPLMTSPEPRRLDFPSATFSHDMGPAGDMIRAFGEEIGGGLVLMSGLEERAAQAVAFRNAPYEEVVMHIAQTIDCSWLPTPWYYMILPEEYAALANLSVSDMMDAYSAVPPADIAIGAKTELYNVFRLVGDSMGVTVVADNFISETGCGEFFLTGAPLPIILQAALQSARLGPDSFVIESTGEYVFLRAPHNSPPPTLLLNEAALDDSQRAFLEEQISLSLPGRTEMARPISLHDALLPLSEQLGIEVVAQRRLADIPVTPCVMNNVRRRTALELLLRQWPVQVFGYELQSDRILIRER